MQGGNSLNYGLNGSSQLKVLLIEDDEADALIFAHQLSADYQLTRVPSCEAAMEAGDGPWDVVILDLGLPGHQGVEALERVRAWRPQVPLVVLTGYDDDGLANLALRRGAQDYLIKGTRTPQDLCRAIRYSVERKRAQVDLETAKAKLKDAERLDAIGVLAAGVAHDFNNLLVTINGNAEILGSYQDPEVREAARAIRQSGERAAMLTRQLLGFSQRGQTLRRRLDLHGLLDGLTSDMSGQDEICSKFDATEATVMGDATQLERLFRDLIQNALDSYADLPGEPRVRLETEVNPEQSSISIRITDQGVGIPEELQSRVLEPYFSTKELGQGLGLSNALGITLGHGGAFQLNSRPSNGTVVTVDLPLCKDESHTKPANGAGPRPNQVGKGKRKVLVVDDERSVRETGKRILSRLGFEVEVSGTPGKTLEALRGGSCTADVILLDMVMPDMHGENFLRKLREFSPRQPVIVCTGYTDLVLDEHDMDCLGVLLKPYTISALSAEIERLCPGGVVQNKVPSTSDRNTGYENARLPC